MLNYICVGDDSKMKEKSILNNSSMKLFIMLCGYFLLVLVLYTFFQIIRFEKCLGLVQLLSTIIPIVIYLLVLKKKEKLKEVITIIIIFLFFILFLPFIYNKTYDLTVDGNSYHKTAIAYIKNGWNPLYESSVEFSENNSNIIQIEKGSKTDLWVDHYPKATWIIAANIYNMTGNIESGKCITLILSIMLVIISYNCLKTIMSRKWSVFLSILLALNPITLSQLFTYYVDSLMGILFAIELFLLFLIKPEKSPKENLFAWIALAAICAIFVNIKYTGLLASGVLAAVFYFYWLIKNRKQKDFKKIFRNITLCFIAVFGIAIFFIGYNSYIKNTVDHLNPLYPIIGDDKVDIITTMQPKSFAEKNMFEKFFISLFSKTENVTYNSGEPELKLPIQVYNSEIEALSLPDVRIGGFGPLFALIIIISTIIFIVAIIKFVKHDKKYLKYITLPIIAILLSMILLGENWWARYVPQLYLLPIGTLILIIYVSKYFKNSKLPVTLISILSFVILFNNYYFLNTDFKSLETFSQINKDLEELKNTDNLKLSISSEGVSGYYYNLNDIGIDYVVKENIKEEDKIYKYCWRIVVEKQ